MRWLVVVAVLAGCKKPPPVTEDPKPDRPVKKQAKPTPPPAECTTDAECVLMPELSCCGECPPPTPYEAVTRSELDAAIIEDDEHCATEDWDCSSFHCSASPPGCKAKAACEGGQCVVASNGC